MSSNNLFFSEQLDQLEKQIKRYNDVLESGFRNLRFPYHLEVDYQDDVNKTFLLGSRVILAFGILVYLAFGFADQSLGRDVGDTIWVIRIVITGSLLLGLVVIYTQNWVRLMVPATSFGMMIVGLSVIYFISLMEEPYSYAYHLGLVPWQVYILVALRNHIRAIAFTSLLVLTIYAIFVFNKQFAPVVPELDALVGTMRSLFLVFWVLLLAMGVFLAYQMEHASRANFLKNRLLTLDAKRLKLLGEELHLLSTTDSLTGLANRRHFETCYDAEWRRAIRSQDAITLIMIDIDYFKNYNDHYGHQAGDTCLRSVSDVFQTYAQRSGELVARYGGEEFIMLLPKMTLEGGQHIARSLCKRIEEMSLSHADSPEKVVTISAGVASCIPGIDDESEQLLKDADRCLYLAKGNGRNQVA